MENTQKAPVQKQWSCFCHKHGGFFLSPNGADITCTPCVSGRAAGTDWVNDIINGSFFSGTKAR